MFGRRKPEPPLESLPLEQQVERLKDELERQKIIHDDQLTCAWRRRRELIECLLLENEALHRLLQAERENRNHERENGSPDVQDR